ncbi:replication protein A 70 kDa DNA-binding subunit B [Tanacetum coccineum]|uniref:Replication protein A 70 kDa DNA-binding subunit B n=1 Tax=Tanacetum coccineum TaxID=301880 RepID=A0ABQ5ILK7_9ASTR
MELIVMDEHNTKMQATVRMGLINRFKHQLEGGNAVTLERYSLGEIQPKFRMVNNALRLSFLSNTKAEKCPEIDLEVLFYVSTKINIIGCRPSKIVKC